MSQLNKTALIIDDEKLALAFYSEVLESKGFKVIQYSCPKKLLSDFETGIPKLDIVLIDYNLPEIKGNDLFKAITQHTKAPTLIFTSESNLDQAVEVIRLGAFDYIEKNFSDTNKLLVSIEKALVHGNLKEENTELKKKIEVAEDDFKFLKSQNHQMMKTIYSAEKVASTCVSSLILGEKGTGKRSLAKYIYKNSFNCNKTFAQINCEAMPNNLLMKELFGDESTPSLISRNINGTLFINEITEMPIDAQHMFVQELENLRSNQIIRIITSSSKDIKKLVMEGKFLERLFYRISIVSLVIPSLRNRKEDIIEQSNFFLQNSAKKYNKNIVSFSEHALKILLSSKLEGNSRELQQIIERAVILCDSNKIEPHLISTSLSTDEENSIFHPEFQANLNLKEIEKEYTKHVINFHNGDLLKAAKTLDVSKRTIYRKIQTNENQLGFGPTGQ